jgi:hypothetical protein
MLFLYKAGQGTSWGWVHSVIFFFLLDVDEQFIVEEYKRCEQATIGVICAVKLG